MFTYVKWYCRQIKPTAEKLQVDAQNFPLDVNAQPIPDPQTAVGKTGGGCFGVGPGMLSFNGSSLSFQLASFYLSEATFEFTVVVQKDERRAAATLELEVVTLPPPEVAIRNGELIVIDQPDCEPAKSVCQQSYESITYADTVIISPAMFVLNPLSDKFTVRLTIASDGNRIGFSQITIKINKPPIGGNCSIASDNSAYCLLSTFTVSCDKWQDPEGIGIAAYNFYYLEHTTDGKTVKAAMASTQQDKLSAVLPYGNFSLYVEVSDSFGAYTLCFIGNITTIMPSKEMVDAYNTTETMSNYASTGNSIQLTMFIKALNSLTANAKWSDISDDAFSNITAEEKMNIITEISDSKSHQLQSLKNLAPPTTIAEVNVYSDVLDSVVSLILNGQAGSMTVGIDAREDCLSTLEKISGSLSNMTVKSASEYEPFVKSALGVMTALMTGMNQILEARQLIPPKDMQAAAAGVLDYDGAIPDDPNMVIPDKMMTVNVSDNMNRAIPLVFHYFNITSPQAAYMITIDPLSNASRLVILVAHEMFPVPGKFLFSRLVEELPFIDDSRTLFIDSDMNRNRTGRFDKKDVERRGVIPLPDNKPEDKYIYEVTFFTGPDSDAPCESQIYFMASGDYDETEVRFLPKANSNLYRRYDRNTFVMTTARPLGSLHYLRVFIDNKGRLPYDSWQLERVVFRDLQKSKQYTFETNAWLALNRRDGLADRTFLCANNNEDMSTFSQRMYNITNRNANQDHIWMSVFLRPTGSRYCRKERIMVCVTFLFVSMLLHAMFYEIEGESPIDAYAYIGPVPIALSQMIKGLAVIIFVLPFTTLLGAVFKRARPRKYVRCRALDAIEKQRERQLRKNGLTREDATEKSKVIGKPEGRRTPKTEPVVKCLPWWTRPFGWIVCGAAMTGSVFMVWSYGIAWGEITTVKWFSSFFTTFLVSILVSQWLKVVLVSCLGSICCVPDHSVEDIDCDEELPMLQEDEEWALMSPLDPSTVRDVHRVVGVTHDDDATKKLSVQLTKDRDMKFIVRGIFVYCLFLAVLFIIVNDKTDINAFLLQRHFSGTFFDDKFTMDNLVFPNELRNTDHFWHYAKNLIMNTCRAQRWYNNDPPYGLRGFLDDRANRMVGYPILRQIRNARFVCSVPYPMNETIPDCTGTRGLLTEDDHDYCANWVLGNASDVACKFPEFKYQNASQLKTLATVGRLGTYSGGGYVIRLDGYEDDVNERLDQLQKVHWIDKRTRAVFLEFSVYNANVNLFMTCMICFEVSEGGGIVTKWRFEPVRLLRLESSAKDNVAFFCELMFVVSTVFFTFRQLWEIKKQRCGYFFQYWNLAELSLVLLSWLEIALYIYKLLLTLAVADEFNRTKGNAYLRMDYPVLVDQFYTCILGLIMFVSVLKLIKLMQFNKRMDVLALTISLCWDELSYFLIAFVIIFFAFSSLFYFIFFLYLLEFSSILSAVQTSFSMMLGKFDFNVMQQANSLSPLLFFIFSVLNSMVLVNIMLAIILKAFNEIKVDLSKRENTYDVLDYMWKHFKKTAVLQPNAVNQVKVNLNKKEREGLQSERDFPDKNKI
ncbi:hypothetical protein HAZT_HAZT010364 [Hyalella azteca]|uniref:PLAT domain-containing protein n=1 Tax=Hyalella azteca TaxID=294128 RepID=A0A6A0H736_HYAAZ|nr:hypothetical protein HAZT_HAZT010364 [Hyalella azteca]